MTTPVTEAHRERIENMGACGRKPYPHKIESCGDCQKIATLLAETEAKTMAWAAGKAREAASWDVIRFGTAHHACHAIADAIERGNP
jgi:hypothetical protein